ncbi:MAG: hypothetical protein CSB55_01110 [Candidatus Cloacimonadota bacterium]|nr:MAG: hypothetical protein CSB55_01110 [Candidatus Cloacimonadota bacterium]
MKLQKYILMMLLFLTAVLFAEDVNVYFEDVGNVIAGEEFILPIKTDSVLTNIYSFEFRITYSQDHLEFIELSEEETLCDGFGFIAVNSDNPGVLEIAAAGSSPLEGTGRILNLKFCAIDAYYASVNFNPVSENFFNEGLPSASFAGISFYIVNPPSLNVDPDSEILGIGKTLQMSVSGAYTGNIVWEVDDENIASIDDSGLLTALSSGIVTVTATDEEGVSGTNDGIIEIRPVSLIPEDSEVFQTNSVNIPVNVTGLNGLEVNSLQFNIRFGDDLECIGINTENTIAEGSETSFQNYGNYALISLASSQNWTEDGLFFELILEATEEDYGNRIIRIESGFFNEDVLFYTEEANCEIKQLPVLEITPAHVEIFAGNTVQLSVSDNATLPVVWTSSNEEVASVDQNGLLTAHKSGPVEISAEDAVNVSGNLSDITVYDGRLKIIQTYAEPQARVKVPVCVEDISPEKAFSSFEINFSYNTDKLEFVEIDKNGCECEDWTFILNENSYNAHISGAGDSDVYDGTLFYLVFDAKESLLVEENAYVTINSSVFNEGFPALKTENNYVTGHPVLEVDFSVANTLAMINADVQFSDLSTGNPIAREWDFDNDGTVDSAEQNPIWQYDAPGIYSVRLTAASLAAEKSIVKEQYIEITEEVSLNLPENGFSFNEDESLNVDFAQYIADCDGISCAIDLIDSDTEEITVDINMTDVVFSAEPNWFGSGNFIFQVYYADRSVSQDTVIVTVLPVNDSPELNLPDSFDFNEDETAEFDLSDFISDIDNESEELSLTFSGNTEISLSFDGFMLTVSAPENWNGSEAVTFALSDGERLTRNIRAKGGRTEVSAEVTFNCLPVNDAPQVIQEFEDLVLDEDFADLSINLNDYFFDPDGDEMIFTPEFNSEHIEVSVTGPVAFISSLENWNGETQIAFIADDGINDILNYFFRKRDFSESSLNITVNPVNDAPEIISFIPEETEFDFTGNLSVSLGFSVEAFDVEGNLNYEWLVNGENQNNDSDSLFVTLEESGDYIIDCLVSDEEYAVNKEWTVHLVVSETDLQVVYYTDLKENYPNPFNPETQIEFSLSKNDNVKIMIYNVKGQLVKVLADAPFKAGKHVVSWKGKDDKGKDVAGGVYFYSMETSDYKNIKKMLMMK